VLESHAFGSLYKVWERTPFDFVGVVCSADRQERLSYRFQHPADLRAGVYF
jgi:hypothetical protein